MVTRQQAEEFVENFLQARESEYPELFGQLESLTGIDRRELAAYLQGESDRNYLIDRILAFEPGELKRTSDELENLVQQLIDGGSDAEQNEWLRIIEANFPEAPEGYVIDLMDEPGGDTLSAKDIVDKLMSYQSEAPVIVTPPPKT